MSNFRKTSFQVLIAGIIFGLMAGCGPTETKTGSDTKGTDVAEVLDSRPAPTAAGNTATDVIKIGLVASENGELRPWGVDCIAGAKLAVEEINATGGIGGKMVELRIEDSQSKPESGKSATEKLAGEGVVGIIGEVASGITAQMAKVAFEKGLPLVAVGATRTDLTAGGSNLFRVCYTDDLQGPVMAKFAYEELGMKNIAILTDQKQPYSTGLTESFRKKFLELGGKVVAEEIYESGQTEFSGQLTNVKAKNPDGLFLSGYFTEVGPIVRQAKNLGINVPSLGGDGWDSSEILISGGEAILGSYFCNHYNNKEDRPEVAEFLSKWRAKYKSEPATTMGALGYDATNLMIDAIKRAKAPNSKDIITALQETTDFKGVSGLIALKGNNGNPPKRALVVELRKEGQVFAKAYEAADVLK